MGLKDSTFSRERHNLEAWEGSLAYGFSADYSGGTAADSHGLPRFPCLQNGTLSVCCATNRVN